MKRCMKFWMVLLIALLLTVIFVPTAVFAADEIASGTCGAEGDNLKWTLQNNYLLTISGEGDMADYTEKSPAPWTKYSSNFDTVRLSKGVASIGDRAFAGCSELQRIEVAESVVEIGNDIVNGCEMSGLMGIYFYGDAPTIAEKALNTVSIEVYYPMWNDTWTTAVLMNYGGTATWKKHDPVWNTDDGICGKHGKNVTWTLSDDGRLTFTGKGEMIGYSYDNKFSWEQYESKIKYIAIGNGITKIGEKAFSNLPNLQTVTVAKSVKTIGERAFLGSSLTSITLAEGVEKIDTYAFRGCRKLKNITIPKSVNYFGLGVFWECESLTDIVFKGNAPSWYDEYDGNAPTFGSIITDRPYKINMYYPGDDATWTDEITADYFGNLTWIKYPLPAPKPTITIDASSGKPQLKWAAVDGAAKYEIHRATSKSGTYTKLWTQKSTTYTNTTAQAGKTYYYKVRAVDAMGNAGKFSAIKSITCDCAKPVTTLTVNSDTGKPRMTWKKVDGASKYEVYRATSKTGTYSKMLTMTGTSYTNTTAVPGKTYYYKVKAICGASTYGNSAFSTAKSITCDCARPVVSISRNASGKPKLTWKAVDGATKYEIYRATSKNGTYYKQYTQQSTTYTNTTAKAGKTYYYKVKAICGKSSYGNSALSAVKYIASK